MGHTDAGTDDEGRTDCSVLAACPELEAWLATATEWLCEDGERRIRAQVLAEFG